MHSSPSVRSTDSSADAPAFRTSARSPCPHASTMAWTGGFQYCSLPSPRSQRREASHDASGPGRVPVDDEGAVGRGRQVTSPFVAGDQQVLRDFSVEECHQGGEKGGEPPSVIRTDPFDTAVGVGLQDSLQTSEHWLQRPYIFFKVVFGLHERAATLGSIFSREGVLAELRCCKILKYEKKQIEITR